MRLFPDRPRVTAAQQNLGAYSFRLPSSTFVDVWAQAQKNAQNLASTFGRIPGRFAIPPGRLTILRSPLVVQQKFPEPPVSTAKAKDLDEGHKMQWSSEVVNSMSSDTESTIMVTFSDSKYMFNTSENTMRSFLQHGRLWRRTKCLFFTQARIEKIGGLPGLIMTFADSTINKLRLIGPPGLNHLLASMRTYTYRDSIALNAQEVPWTSRVEPKPCFTDENITVYAIPAIPIIREPTPAALPEDASEVTVDDESSDINGKRKRDVSEEAPRKRLNVGNESSVDAGFIIESDEVESSNKHSDDFRKLLIKHMFPGTNIPTTQETSGCATDAPAPVFYNGDIEEMRKKRPFPTGFWSQLPKFTNPFASLKSPPTMSYLLVGPVLRGKFDVAKADALGVPKGPARGKLTKGEPITVEVVVDGEKVMRTINPEDVLEKSDPRGSVLILDVPTPEHVPGLISSFQCSEFYRNFWSEDGSHLPDSDSPKFILRTIYQTCGEGVLEDELYQKFLRGFGSGPDHVVASREYCPDPITFTSVTQNQLRLSRIDSSIFPVPKYSLTPKKDLSAVPGLPEKITPMASNLQAKMRPYTAPSPDPYIVALDKFHPLVDGSQPLELSPIFQSYVNQAQTAVAQVLATGEIKPEEGSDVRIVALGTGGSLPSKYRNVLSTLVQIPGWGNILLDAGEGTWGQLARTFGLEGPDNVFDTLRNLKCIFISHVHADHHIGLAQILAKRRQLNPPPSEPLYVVSIRSIHLYLRELQDVQDIGIDDPSGNGVVHVLSESIHYKALGKYMNTGMWMIGGEEEWLEYNKSVESARKMCDALGLEYFKTADVEHRCRAFGASFKHKDGWSITFSGDTSPTASLRQIGMNSTVLIHEATMGDDEWEIARSKAHSTIGQAIGEGEAMNAKVTLLTHFSARYPKLPLYLVKNSGLQKVRVTSYKRDRLVVPAFDYLNVRIGDMWKIQFYLRAMVQAINKEGLDMVTDYDPGSPSPPPS